METIGVLQRGKLDCPGDQISDEYFRKITQIGNAIHDAIFN